MHPIRSPCRSTLPTPMPQVSCMSFSRFCRKPLVAFALTASVSLGATNETSPVTPELQRKRNIAAAVRATLPAYTPAPAARPEADPGDTAGIILLDPVTVSDDRPQSATEWEMLTDKGRADLLKKKYRGSTPPGDPLSNTVRNYAMLRFRDDKRLDDLKAMNDLADTARAAGDLARQKYLKKEIQRALVRPTDWETESMDKSYNNHRN